MDIVKSMVYPGRIIIIGTAPAGQRVVLYSITGRSPSSQARRLEIDKQAGSIFVKPTDEETLKTGNPDLLVYPAVICKAGAIAVSNGKQTGDVAKLIRPCGRAGRCAFESLWLPGNMSRMPRTLRRASAAA